jgi:hypothetical protein
MRDIVGKLVPEVQPTRYESRDTSKKWPVSLSRHKIPVVSLVHEMEPKTATLP